MLPTHRLRCTIGRVKAGARGRPGRCPPRAPRGPARGDGSGRSRTSRRAGAGWPRATATTYRSFAPLRAAILSEVKARDTILDGEIVCLDAEGRSLFNPLLFRRRRPVFAVFDLLWVNGEDLRGLPLIERKARLRALVPRESPDLLHVDAVPEKGQELFQAACERDLEGVVGKWARGTIIAWATRPSGSRSRHV